MRAWTPGRFAGVKRAEGVVLTRLEYLLHQPHLDNDPEAGMGRSSSGLARRSRGDEGMDPRAVHQSQAGGKGVLTGLDADAGSPSVAARRGDEVSLPVLREPRAVDSAGVRG
jgi:hypothetical protein